MEKTTKYRWFCTFLDAKNWKKIQSGIGHKYTSYSGVKLKSQQIALCEAEILLPVVQNAENPSVRESKTRSIRGSYAPKEPFCGCDRSSWVYAGWHCDDITDTAVNFT